MALIDDLESYWKLDESSGTRVDSHGSNDLTDNNTVGTADGGADFENSNTETLSHTSNSSLETGGTSFTFNLWIKAESLTSDNAIFAKDAPSNREFALYYWGGSFYWWVGNGSFLNQVGITAPSTGVKTMVTVYYDHPNDLIGIGFDGGSPTTTSVSGDNASTSADFCLGGDFFSGGAPTSSRCYDGIMYQVGFWKRLLTSDEKTELYNSGAGLDYPFTTGTALTGVSATGSVGTLYPVGGDVNVPLTGVSATGSVGSLAYLADSLVSYWPLNESSGNALDAHNGNDLTDTNTVGAASGKVAGARDFEVGNTEYFTHADNSSLSVGSNSISVTCWVKLESKSTFQSLVTKHDGTTGGSEFVLAYHQLADRFTFTIYHSSTTTAVNADNLGSPALDTWYFVVARYNLDIPEISISVNAGTPNTASVSSSVNDGTGLFQLGGLNGGFTLDGLLDEVGWWKGRALSQAEVEILYNAGNGLAYPFTGDTSPALTGVSATGSVGTLSVTFDIALTGVSATGAVGTLSPSGDTALALTGVQATGSVGTLSVTFEIALTGVSATGSVGTLTPDITGAAALTGVSATGSVGTLSITFSTSLTGVSATGAVGTLVPSVEILKALTGVSATGSVGSLSVTFSKALTGVSAVGSVGTMTPLGDILGMTIDSPIILTPTFSGPVTLSNGMGTAGQVYTSQGSSTTPSWTDPATGSSTPDIIQIQVFT